VRSAALLLLLAACHDWREHVDPARVTAMPEQTPLDARPMELHGERLHIRLTPRARYRVKGYVAETSRELKHTKFHLSKRYFSMRYEPPTVVPLPREFGRYMSNNHLVPANAALQAELDRVRIGDLLTLEGRLVDIEIKDQAGRLLMRSPTSLSRDDAGNGACEQLWVEALAIE